MIGGIAEKILDFGYEGTAMLTSPFIVNNPISGKLEEVIFKSPTENYDIIVTYWKRSGYTYSRIGVETFNGYVADRRATIRPTFYSKDEYYVGFIPTSGLYGSSVDYKPIVAYVNTADETVTIGGGATRPGYLPSLTIKYAINEERTISTVEAHVGKGCKYKQIQEALDDNKSAEYLTIFLHASDEPYERFSTLRSLDEAYPWDGIMCKNISIIGLDKHKCIVKDDSGNYDTPPAEIAVNGTIANIIFIATHDASTEDFNVASYAVHIDNRPLDSNGYHMIFDNCDFISEQTSGVGIGIYKNQTLEFVNCTFINNASLSYKPNADYSELYAKLGAFFVHTSMGYDEGNENLIVRNCKMLSKECERVLLIRHNDDDVNSFTFEAINNTLWSFGSNSVGYYEQNLPVNMKPYNHGNNAEELNS
jgi:hypothetical protein